MGIEGDTLLVGSQGDEDKVDSIGDEGTLPVLNGETAPISAEEEKRLVTKVTYHVMPIVCGLFLFAFLDRANLANMHIAIQEDIPMTQAQFGNALGIFYILYVMFQLPSNYLLDKLRPRIWIAIIAVVWGFVTTISISITNSTMLIIFRFLLGLAESGLAPALMLYITMWFNESHRGVQVSIFMMAIPISSFVSGLLSGLIITNMDGILGMSGWRWLFITEGLPTIMMGVVVFIYLPNTPNEAKFLDAREKQLYIQIRGEDEQSKNAANLTPRIVLDTLKSAKNWWLAICGFWIMCTSAGMAGFLPTILYEFGTLSSMASNLLSSLPNGVAIFSLYFWSRHSDKTNERFWHSIGGLAVAVIGLLLCALFLHMKSLPLFIIAAIIYSVGFWAGESVFITYATSLVAGSPAIAIALFNSVFTFGGWLGPYVMGILRDRTSSHVFGILFITLTLLISGGVIVVIKKLYGQSTKAKFIQMTDLSIEDDDDFVIL